MAQNRLRYHDFKPKTSFCRIYSLATIIENSLVPIEKSGYDSIEDLDPNLKNPGFDPLKNITDPSPFKNPHLTLWNPDQFLQRSKPLTKKTVHYSVSNNFCQIFTATYSIKWTGHFIQYWHKLLHSFSFT